MEKAKHLLEKGEKLINERQKHIRIADRSDNGWATVEEYVEDESADNEDDEKLSFWADISVGKKLKSAQKTGRGSAKKFFPKHIWNFRVGMVFLCACTCAFYTYVCSANLVLFFSVMDNTFSLFIDFCAVN